MRYVVMLLLVCSASNGCCRGYITEEDYIKIHVQLEDEVNRLRLQNEALMIQVSEQNRLLEEREALIRSLQQDAE